MHNMGYHNLGYISLGVLYGSLAIGCLVSTSILKLIGTKNSLMVGSLSITLWILCSIFPSLKIAYPDSTSVFISESFIYSIVIIASVIDGFGEAI